MTPPPRVLDANQIDVMDDPHAYLIIVELLQTIREGCARHSLVPDPKLAGTYITRDASGLNESKHYFDPECEFAVLGPIGMARSVAGLSNESDPNAFRALELHFGPFVRSMTVRMQGESLIYDIGEISEPERAAAQSIIDAIDLIGRRMCLTTTADGRVIRLPHDAKVDTNPGFLATLKVNAQMLVLLALIILLIWYLIYNH